MAFNDNRSTESPIVYRLEVETIYGKYYYSPKAYYSIRRALYAAKSIFVLNNLLRVKYESGKLLLNLVYIQRDEVIAVQSINFK